MRLPIICNETRRDKCRTNTAIALAPWVCADNFARRWVIPHVMPYHYRNFLAFCFCYIVFWLQSNYSVMYLRINSAINPFNYKFSLFLHTVANF